MDGLLAVEVAHAPIQLNGLFREIGDLKRIRSAGREGSVAERGFRSAWRDLVAGDPAEAVMRRSVAAALAAVRLGDLDGPKLRELGLSEGEAKTVLQRGFDAVASALDPALASQLRAYLTCEPRPGGPAPAFVEDLARQPRAGATCPGAPRLVLEPPENHAEHSWAVAVFGVLLSPTYGADPTVVFTAALAHHLHSAAMPDSGFTGEILLGDRLGAVLDHATGMALDQLEASLRAEVRRAREILPNANTAEGQAFHAADVIDRVEQIAQHLRPASTTLAMVLDDMGLVHDGPVKAFHDQVLREMGVT